MAAFETPGVLKRLFLNPLALREIRHACRSWKLVVFLSIYLLIQGAIFAIWIFAKNDKGIFRDPTSIGSGLFITLSIVLVAVVMLVFPAFSSTAIASEHEKKSFDLLMLTPLSPWEIALGKFMAAAIQASVFLIATVPLFAMANLFGGIQGGVFFVTLWGLVLFSVLISFIGVYASSLVTRAIPAVLVTYLFSFVIGFVILVVFVSLVAARGISTAALPVLSFFSDPTLNEGIFYVAGATANCAVYCTFLFLSTTNRLKPTSHNKSTNMRLFWTTVVVVQPAVVAGYFWFARIPSVGTALGTLVTGTIYLAAMLLVPALSFPAEPPLPSRRVRREMEKLPQGLLNAGGRIFYPGGARGVLHLTLISVVGFLLLVLTARVCFGALDDRLEERAKLVADFSEHVLPVISNPTAAPMVHGAGAIAVPTHLTDGQMREAMGKYFEGYFQGFLMMCGAMLATLLVAAQAAWRLSLSGLSRGVCGVLAGLLLAVWVVVPYIAEAIGGSDPSDERAYMAQFSPVQGAYFGAAAGGADARAGLVSLGGSTHYGAQADAYAERWLSFMLGAGLIGGGLLLSNLVSHRRVSRLIGEALRRGESQSASPPPGSALPQPPAPSWAAPETPATPAQPPVAAAPVAPDQPELPPMGEIKTD
ncbi:MAG: ABC transporter permease [Planctomycetes bacterium]|nr:ABC transporter permease [Planctomycetota bacterium]